MGKRRFAAILGALAIAGFGSLSSASAHTISIGTFNAGLPGSVTVVLGTYTSGHGAIVPEGAIQLIAGPTSPSAVMAFGSVITTKPSGLTDGVNNFYADSDSSNWGSLASDSYNQSTNTVELGAVTHWMPATFTGLAPGLYTYQITGMFSDNWENINSFDANWTGTLLIPRASTVAEPMALALFGLGLAGVGVAARRRKE